MNNEIKEMNLSEMLFNRDERLLDYITNLQEEIKKKDNRIHALEKHNEKLQLEAQKYFDLLMEYEYGDKKGE